MTTPTTSAPTGQHLFTYYGFVGPDLTPQLTLLADDAQHFTAFEPRGRDLTLEFELTQRYCTGWHDLRTGDSHPCPDAATTPEAYDQCRACQQRTGFNPAFYNAASVSPQQEERNRQPHFLYLAHFAPGVVKVGISHAGRGLRRLLEQGARSCLILQTYPDAHGARTAEAAIAALPGIAETIQVRQKLSLLGRPYDPAAAATELRTVRERLIAELHLPLSDADPQDLGPHYLAPEPPTLEGIIDLTADHAISGRCLGLIGGILICTNADILFALSLSKLKGYRVTLSPEVHANAHAPVQIGLF